MREINSENRDLHRYDLPFVTRFSDATVWAVRWYYWYWSMINASLGLSSYHRIIINNRNQSEKKNDAETIPFSIRYQFSFMIFTASLNDTLLYCCNAPNTAISLVHGNDFSVACVRTRRLSSWTIVLSIIRPDAIMPTYIIVIGHLEGFATLNHAFRNNACTSAKIQSGCVNVKAKSFRVLAYRKNLSKLLARVTEIRQIRNDTPTISS